MVGDLADDFELHSGKRQEVILYATVGFMQKLNAGLGSFFAGMVLAFIGFDKDNPSIEQGYTLALVQGPGTTLLMIVPFIIFLGYSLSSSRHKEIIKSLK